MSKTLADMTADERQACVGMWCEYKDGSGIKLAILADTWAINPEACMLYSIDHQSNIQPLGRDTTPRFDLPRAWNPDGTPPEWDWQYADYTPGMNRGFYSVDESVEKGPELSNCTFRARRPVGEWEEDK